MRLKKSNYRPSEEFVLRFIDENLKNPFKPWACVELLKKLHIRTTILIKYLTTARYPVCDDLKNDLKTYNTEY